jgi:hypothetical protein
VAYGASKLLGGGSDAPAMPAMPGMPALPDNSGLYNVTHGPGGALAIPGFGPNKMAGARTLDDSYLKVAYRAPKGYRVVRDEKGKPYAMEKHDAIRAGLSKRHHRPPISVGQWHALKKAKHVVKVLRKCDKEAARLMSFGHKGHRTAHPNVMTFAPAKRKAA